jgi:hypothetical protein
MAEKYKQIEEIKEKIKVELEKLKTLKLTLEFNNTERF